MDIAVSGMELVQGNGNYDQFPHPDKRGGGWLLSCGQLAKSQMM